MRKQSKRTSGGGPVWKNRRAWSQPLRYENAEVNLGLHPNAARNKDSSENSDLHAESSENFFDSAIA